MIVQTVGVKQTRTRKSGNQKAREGHERRAGECERGQATVADTEERDRARGAMY